MCFGLLSSNFAVTSHINHVSFCLGTVTKTMTNVAPQIKTDCGAASVGGLCLLICLFLRSGINVREIDDDITPLLVIGGRLE